MGPHETMLFKIKEVLNNQNTEQGFYSDIITSFRLMGVQSEMLLFQIAARTIAVLKFADSLVKAEKELHSYFSNNYYGDKTLQQIIEFGLYDRIETVFNEIEPHLHGLSGKLIDYGAGSCLLGQTISNLIPGLIVSAVDVRDFRQGSIKLPFVKIDGYHVEVVDGYYDYGISIHVLHHDKNPELVIRELTRIIKSRLIVIETVSEKDDEFKLKDDWGRIFLNDVMWNRLFNKGDIPVPGSYNTPTNWKKSFTQFGWQCIDERFLGKDLKTIQDDHHLMVFEK